MIYADATSVIGACSSLVVAFGVFITAWATYRNGKKIDAGRVVTDDTHAISKDVQNQVTTFNGLTLANLADNDEKRRAEAVAMAERTSAEVEHADAPISTGSTDVAGEPKTDEGEK